MVSTCSSSGKSEGFHVGWAEPARAGFSSRETGSVSYICHDVLRNDSIAYRQRDRAMIIQHFADYATESRNSPYFWKLQISFWGYSKGLFKGQKEWNNRFLTARFNPLERHAVQVSFHAIKVTP
jgi:hypothetical protein